MLLAILGAVLGLLLLLYAWACALRAQRATGSLEASCCCNRVDWTRTQQSQPGQVVGEPVADRDWSPLRLPGGAVIRVPRGRKLLH